MQRRPVWLVGPGLCALLLLLAANTGPAVVPPPPAPLSEQLGFGPPVDESELQRLVEEGVGGVRLAQAHGAAAGWFWHRAHLKAGSHGFALWELNHPGRSDDIRTLRVKLLPEPHPGMWVDESSFRALYVSDADYQRLAAIAQWHQRAARLASLQPVDAR